MRITNFQLFIVVILSIGFSFFLTALFIPGSFFGFFLFFGLSFFGLMVFAYRYIISRPMGKFKISPFALSIDGVGAWKVGDPYDLEAPTQLRMKTIKVKKFDEYTGEDMGEDFDLELDFRKIWSDLVDRYVEKNIFAELAKPIEEFCAESSVTDKGALRIAIKDILKYILTIDSEPKLHTVISAENELVMFWFGNSQPAEYAITTTKQSFRGWKMANPFKGMPSVEAFGVVLKYKYVLEEILEFDCLLCLPIFDESYRKFRSLNLMKYSNIIDTLATMAQKFNSALPMLDYVEILEKEKLRALRQRALAISALDTAYSDIAEVSAKYTGVLSDVANIFGSVSTMPNAPEQFKEAVKHSFMPRVEENLKEAKSLSERIKKKAGQLLKEEKKPEEEELSEETEKKEAEGQ